MPYCSECGKNYQDTAKFCPHCGAPNTISESSQTEQQVESFTANFPSEFQTQKRARGSSYGAYRLEDLPEGFLIDDRYEVKKKLGQGGFGAVYLAYDNKMAIEKALKIIPESVASDKEAMSDLQSEARTMVSLNHKNIVRVFDVHDTGSIKYIDMEYVAGKALNEVKLDYEGKKLPEELVKSLAVKIALGLSYAHKNNIIHKDIKPQNIMLTGDGSVKIMDFGISETVQTSMSRVANSSSSGTLVYMAPEQVKGQNIGKESDIYSFGALLYELLSGHPPFYKGAIEYQIFNEKPADITGVSTELNIIIQKCLEKDFKERFRSFEEVETEFIGDNLSESNDTKLKSKISITEGLPVLSPAEKAVFLLKQNFVLVEGGIFQMGSKKGDSDEKPVHSVEVSPFYMSKYEVTQGLYSKVMGSNPSFSNRGIGDNYPVNMVRWHEAVKFCNKLSEIDKLESVYDINGNTIICNWLRNGYRLPTEAEWEYAARGGNKSKDYSYAGSKRIENVAWYSDNSVGEAHPVGQKQANELGLYDMSGNVWEWCWDWYGGYENTGQINPQGNTIGSRRVGRGGSFNYYISDCRSTNRNNYDSDYFYYYLGFRLVCSAVR